jgi:hypothetical protein
MSFNPSFRFKLNPAEPSIEGLLKGPPSLHLSPGAKRYPFLLYLHLFVKSNGCGLQPEKPSCLAAGVALSCPFCYIMLENATKEKDMEAFKVYDVLEPPHKALHEG